MPRGEYPSSKQDQYMVRFPDGMRDELKAIAKRHGRSLNAEIILRLNNSLVREVGTESDLGQAFERISDLEDAVDRQKEEIGRLRSRVEEVCHQHDDPNPRD